MSKSRYNAPDHSSMRQTPPNFPEPNLPGFQTGGYTRSRYHGAPQGNGTTHCHPTYEDPYPQPPTLPRVQPGMPMGYDTSHWRASQQPPIGPSPRSEYDPSWSDPPAHFPLPGVVSQQSPGPMNAPWFPSQGPAGGSYFPRSANESYFPSNPGGFVGQQNPPPMTPPRSEPQGFASEWNAIPGSYSHSGRPLAANGSYSPHPPAGFFFQQNPRPITAASPYRGPAGVQDTLGPYPRTDRTAIARKRKALIIGINYSRHSDRRFELKCCVEDARSMADFICANLYFAASDIRLMTDESRTPLWNYPSKENILGAMRELVRDAQHHDSFFIYFSGHGVQIEDENGDESDGLDECICATDYLGNDPRPNANTSGLIVDDIMHEILVKPLPPQCRLTAIFDSCHSGTILDLPHIYRSDGVVKRFRHPYRLEVLREKESKAVAISLSASKDNQKARESHLGGALRQAFIDSMRTSNNTLTYKELIQSVRKFMKENRFRQRPQLSSSHEIDTNLQFIV